MKSSTLSGIRLTFVFSLSSNNSKLKNKKFNFELLIQKMEKQNFKSKVIPDFIIKMKYYAIQNYLKKM